MAYAPSCFSILNLGCLQQSLGTVSNISDQTTFIKVYGEIGMKMQAHVISGQIDESHSENVTF